METEIIKIHPGEGPVSEEDEEKLRAAGAILQRGGLVAFPTETVYGLGGDALNPSSSQKIYAAKGRPSDNPLIVHIYRFEDIYKITKEVPEEARKIADALWPGYGSNPYALASGGTEADQIQRRIYCGTKCQYFRQAQSHSGKIRRRRYDGSDRCHH